MQETIGKIARPPAAARPAAEAVQTRKRSWRNATHTHTLGALSLSATRRRRTERHSYSTILVSRVRSDQLQQVPTVSERQGEPRSHHRTPASNRSRSRRRETTPDRSRQLYNRLVTSTRLHQDPSHPCRASSRCSNRRPFLRNPRSRPTRSTSAQSTHSGEDRIDADRPQA